MKIKTASPVCGICKTRGHFRLDCPQLPNLQRHVDLDQPPEDPSEDPIITWAQARDKMNEDISSIVDQSERSSEYSFAGIDEDQSTDDDKTLIMETEKQPESQTISDSYPPPGHMYQQEQQEPEGQSTASWADLVKRNEDGEEEEEENY